MSTTHPPEVGATVPDFQLQDSDGNLVNLDECVKHGLLVLVFYRGHW